MILLRKLLFPFSAVYLSITSIRNLFYDFNIFKSYNFSIPTIVVGNLSVGGTGKTPHIEYLINLLKDNFKVAVLSRGYKRKTEEFIIITENSLTIDVGDEPMQFYRKFKNIDVAVDKDRVNGIKLLLKKKSPDLVLLDDAFQHRRVKSSFNILLTKFDDLFTDDYVLPVGNLRERRRGANRSNLIIVTKCPNAILSSQKKEILEKLKKYKKDVFFSKIAYSNRIYGSLELPIEDLKQYKVLLITGIANPHLLIDFLTKKNILFDHQNYPDHHNFSKNEIDTIKYSFNKINSSKKIILTTEKDYMRLEGYLDISYLPIKIEFIKDENVFNSKILEHISSFN